jgi:hypothetical protein
VTTTNDTVEMRVGSKDVILSPGQYTYTLTYMVSNNFSRFPDWDELYWNVTDNDWAFPIDKVRFRLHYREGAGAPHQAMPMRTLDVYTGYLGQQGQNFRILPGDIVEAVAPLDRGEGITVAWTWPRGFLADAQDPIPCSLLKKLFIVPLWEG